MPTFYKSEIKSSKSNLKSKQKQLSPFCRAAGCCTGNYDLRLTIGRNARISSLPTLPWTNVNLDLVWYRNDWLTLKEVFGLVSQRLANIKRSVCLLTFSWSKSRASWSPTAFMSVRWRADVTYMCMSRNLSRNELIRNDKKADFINFQLCCLFVDLLIAPPCSACSISSCERSLTNHSKLFWSRLIQKKSTCDGLSTQCIV